MIYMFENSFVKYLIFRNSIFMYAIVLLAAYYVYLYKLRDREHHKKLEKQFPSFSRLPIIGSLHLTFGNETDRLKKIVNLIKKKEYPLIFWILHIPFVCLTKYEDIQIMSKKSQERYIYGALENIFGKQSIITAGENIWKRTRRIMNPAFNLNMLQQYVSVFNEKGHILIGSLKSKADTDQLFNIWDEMVNLHIGIITENITGTKFDSNSVEGIQFSRVLLKSMELESYRIVSPWLYPNFMYSFYLYLTGNKDVFKDLKKLPSEIIQKKKEEYSKHAKNNVIDQQFFEDNPPSSLVDFLLQAHYVDGTFSDNDLLEEVLSMIIVGSESTAITGSFVLFMLAMHPKVQEEAYREIKSVFEDKEKSLQLEDLNNMPFVEQCIKETLRMFSLIPLTIRKTTGEVTLSDKRVIPANTLTIMNLHGVHIDPDKHANPDIWDPNHFLPNSDEIKQKNNFAAFGLGPRGCIGAKYAVLSLKTMIALILRSYRLSTTHTMADVQLTMDMAIRNKNGYHIKLHSREN